MDSAIAYSVMTSLDNYAKLSRKTVVTTIHQPSSQIFHMFTNILLLSEGQVCLHTIINAYWLMEINDRVCCKTVAKPLLKSSVTSTYQ